MATNQTLSLLLGFALLACSDFSSNRKTEEKNSTTRRNTLLVISDSPSVTIGEAEGDPNYEFSEVMTAMRRDDGSIVVVDGGTNTIRFYDARGKFVRKVGRTGKGPGEYSRLGELKQIRDGFIAIDWILRRWSLLSRDGKYLRSVKPPDVPVIQLHADTRGYPVFVHDILGQFGSNVVLRRSTSPATYGARYKPDVIFRDTVEYLLARIPDHEDEAMQIVDTLAVALGGMQATKLRAIPNGNVIQVAYHMHFSPFSAFAMGADRVYVADSDSFAIRVYDRDGKLIRVIREDRPLEQVNARDVERGKRRLGGNSRDERGIPFASSETKKWVDWYYENMPLPKTKPSRALLEVDANQNLWVQDYSITVGANQYMHMPDDPARWWTFYDSAGSRLGRVQMPENFTVMQIGTNFVLGVLIDDMDVQTVALFEFRK